MGKIVTNCPNCGAPLRGYGRCEYCGTVFVRYDEKIETLKAELAKKKAELSNAAQAQYILNMMGKWAASPVPKCGKERI